MQTRAVFVGALVCVVAGGWTVDRALAAASDTAQAEETTLFQQTFAGDPGRLDNFTTSMWTRLDRNNDSMVDQQELVDAVQLLAKEMSSVAADTSNNANGNRSEILEAPAAPPPEPFRVWSWLQSAVTKSLIRSGLRSDEGQLMWDILSTNSTEMMAHEEGKDQAMDQDSFRQLVDMLYKHPFPRNETICEDASAKIRQCSDPKDLKQLYELGGEITSANMQCRRGLAYLNQYATETCVLNAKDCAAIGECYSQEFKFRVLASSLTTAMRWALEGKMQQVQVTESTSVLRVLFFNDTTALAKEAEFVYEKMALPEDQGIPVEGWLNQSAIALPQLPADRQPIWTQLLAYPPLSSIQSQQEFVAYMEQRATETLTPNLELCQQSYLAALSCTNTTFSKDPAQLTAASVFQQFQQCAKGLSHVRGYPAELCISRIADNAADACAAIQHCIQRASSDVQALGVSLQKRAALPMIAIWFGLGLAVTWTAIAAVILLIPFWISLAARGESVENERLANQLEPLLPIGCQSAKIYWGRCGAPTSEQSRQCPDGGEPWRHDSCSSWVSFSEGSRLCRKKPLPTAFEDFGNRTKADGSETVRGWNRLTYNFMGRSWFQCQSLCVKYECSKR